jgi:hypothetical protein
VNRVTDAERLPDVVPINAVLVNVKYYFTSPSARLTRSYESSVAQFERGKGSGVALGRYSATEPRQEKA